MQEKKMIKDIILIVLMMGATVYAVFSRRLLFSIISLGISSVLLAIIFFDLDAPYAGGFELSIGAGLISLLFIMVLSLMRKEEG